MGKRNKLKVTAVLMKKSNEKSQNSAEGINTDILNVYYNEV